MVILLPGKDDGIDDLGTKLVNFNLSTIEWSPRYMDVIIPKYILPVFKS